MARKIIFTVNPGTTSTRCALYKLHGSGVQLIHQVHIEHSDDDIKNFSDISDQFAYRFEKVKAYVNQHIYQDDQLVACAGRGGMLTPVPSGVIKVNEELVKFSLETPVYKHASNLGSPLAYAIAGLYGVDAFIADPVSVDEFPPVARIAGTPEFKRFSFVHALNVRACVRRLAKQLNKEFKETSAVVAHLGAGFSIAAVNKGRIVDNSNRMECSPFSPERTGGLPPLPLIELCYSGKYTKTELLKKLYGQGGVYGYLGTRDIRAVETMIQQGDEKAALIYEAMLYQVVKAIGAMAAAISFNMDGIILTGGIVNSEKVVKYLKARLEKVSSVYVYAGSNENESLAEATANVIRGAETYMTWPVEFQEPGPQKILPQEKCA